MQAVTAPSGTREGFLASLGVQCAPLCFFGFNT